MIGAINGFILRVLGHLVPPGESEYPFRGFIPDHPENMVAEWRGPDEDEDASNPARKGV